MALTLIPFAIDKDTKQMVAVEDVPRGLACNCVCPSCNLPLSSRQGEKKRWHFAHATQAAVSDSEACEISFGVSVRLMLRQLIQNGMTIATPAMTFQWNHDYPNQPVVDIAVTSNAVCTIEEVGVAQQFSNTTVDIKASVAAIPLVIYCTYENRRAPEQLYNPDETRCAVLEFQLDTLEGDFELHHGRYRERLLRYLNHDIDGKRWLYHPRLPKLIDAKRNELKKQHLEMVAQQQKQQEQARQQLVAKHKREEQEAQRQHQAYLEQQRKTEEQRKQQKELGFRRECTQCQHVWYSKNSLFGLNCPNCKTYRNVKAQE